jgi:sugar/nucleoside kinase (ribokinase family)
MSASSSKRVVCLGQFTADVVVAPVYSLPEKGKSVGIESISLHNGGCACNTAVALGKLGIDTAAIGKIGHDTFGNFLIETLKGVNVDTSAMIRDAGVNTSSTAVLVDPDGERSFLHYSGGNAAISETDIDYDAIGEAKILHVAAAFLVPGLDGEPMARVLAKAQKMGVMTCLDTAWDAKDRWMALVEPCLSHLDMFMPSIEEAQMLTGLKEPSEMAKVFLDYGIKTVVIKLGPKGNYARTADGEFSVPEAPVDRVVDTLGAGDSFNAGLLAGIVQGWDLEKSCRLANAVGACCVSAAGASGIMSLKETLERYPI